MPHLRETVVGPLVEIPVSVVDLFGLRVCLFGGGYLRLFPWPVIRWGAARLRARGQPMIVYIHPRDIDPDHPRLPIGVLRRFKSYYNLKGTMQKLRNLCQEFQFRPMCHLAECVIAGLGALPELAKPDKPKEAI